MAMSLHSTDQVSNEAFLPFHDHEVADALLSFFSDSSDTAHLAVDSLFDRHDDHFSDQNDFIFLPSFNRSSLSAPSMLDLPPLADDEFDLYPCPKRPRSCGDLYSNNSYDLMMLESNSYSNVPVVAPAMAHLNATVATLPIGAMCIEDGKKKGAASSRSGCPSAQSVAARERRKRISEKTQELGKLIPGGSRMNTAEMFQAAHKYVKLLQAQAGILAFIKSIQNGKVSAQVEERLQVLLSSTMIQEKLCMEEHCLIPKEAVEAMREEKEIKSNPWISRELDRFNESMK